MFYKKPLKSASLATETKITRPNVKVSNHQTETESNPTVLRKVIYYQNRFVVIDTVQKNDLSPSLPKNSQNDTVEDSTAIGSSSEAKGVKNNTDNSSTGFSKLATIVEVPTEKEESSFETSEEPAERDKNNTNKKNMQDKNNAYLLSNENNIRYDNVENCSFMWLSHPSLSSLTLAKTPSESSLIDSHEAIVSSSSKVVCPLASVNVIQASDVDLLGNVTMTAAAIAAAISGITINISNTTTAAVADPQVTCSTGKLLERVRTEKADASHLPTFLPSAGLASPADDAFSSHEDASDLRSHHRLDSAVTDSTAEDSPSKSSENSTKSPDSQDNIFQGVPYYKSHTQRESERSYNYDYQGDQREKTEEKKEEEIEATQNKKDSCRRKELKRNKHGRHSAGVNVTFHEKTVLNDSKHFKLTDCDNDDVSDDTRVLKEKRIGARDRGIIITSTTVKATTVTKRKSPASKTAATATTTTTVRADAVARSSPASTASVAAASPVTMDTRSIEIIVNDENETSHVGYSSSSRGGGGGGAAGGEGGGCRRSREGTGDVDNFNSDGEPGNSSRVSGVRSLSGGSLPSGASLNATKGRTSVKRAASRNNSRASIQNKSSMEKNMTWKRISKILLDDRMGDIDDREKVLNLDEPGQYRVLKKVLNILFVTIGIALLLAVIVVVIYTAIDDYIQSDIPLPTDKNDENILPFFPSSISSYASNIHIDAEAASKIADLTRTLTNRFEADFRSMCWLYIYIYIYMYI
ncbi:uncharacterized protein LOC106868055 isoform X1 [Octopus bimaculoides]|uniref:uncharacterized protein LOC106868055 isoform X1 n=1 Tax=Octopus bimaculoides TaxID=37653 RepID=UPI0022E10B84|nr:uncharacterized protein LOC106868055 isoform X1 [Octopus bimaculoides]